MSMMNRKISIKFSGTKTADEDTKQIISFVYVFDWDGQNPIPPAGYKSYEEVYNNLQEGNRPIMINYKKDAFIGTDETKGFNMPNDKIDFYSIYKKEDSDYESIYKPVIIKNDSQTIYDFNISNKRQYKYIIYPGDQTINKEKWLNETDSIPAPDPIRTDWQYWSITELELVSSNTKVPSIKKTYKADLNNIWLFKYDFESGDQEQSISKTEQSNLGQYSRFGHGLKNAINGSVSCYLGSSLIQGKYVEKLNNNIKPTTNESMDMLYAWRKLVYSKNPKLLKDKNGQKWIVQIISSSNKVQDNVGSQPNKINFSWIEIASTENIIITN